jgi:hypothetical protein
MPDESEEEILEINVRDEITNDAKPMNNPLPSLLHEKANIPLLFRKKVIPKRTTILKT